MEQNNQNTALLVTGYADSYSQQIARFQITDQ